MKKITENNSSCACKLSKRKNNLYSHHIFVCAYLYPIETNDMNTCAMG